MFEGTSLYLTITALIIFLIGLYILASHRHMIKKLIGIEMLVGAVNLNALSMALELNVISETPLIDPFVGVIIIVSTTIGAVVAAVGFGLAYWSFESCKTLNTNCLSKLKH